MRKLYGFDLLGLANKHFPAKMVLKELPSGIAIGAFDHPFGPVAKRIIPFLDSGKVLAVRIQLYWDAAHKKLIPISRLKTKCRQWQKLALTYPAINFYLCHTCEHTSRDKASLTTRISIIKDLAPNCMPVNNPLGSGLTIPGITNESHGTGRTLDFWSADGTDLLEMGGKKLVDSKAGAKIRFLWTSSDNLRIYGQSSPPPKKRTHKKTVEEMRKLKRMMR